MMKDVKEEKLINASFILIIQNLISSQSVEALPPPTSLPDHS
jgi:hypothetical protein